MSISGPSWRHRRKVGWIVESFDRWIHWRVKQSCQPEWYKTLLPFLMPPTCRQSFATVCSPTVRVVLSSAVPETRYTHITKGPCVSGTPSYPQSTLATIQNTIKGSESSSKRNLLQLEVLPW